MIDQDPAANTTVTKDSPINVAIGVRADSDADRHTVRRTTRVARRLIGIASDSAGGVERKVLSAFAHGDFAFGRQRNRVRSQIR